MVKKKCVLFVRIFCLEYLKLLNINIRPFFKILRRNKDNENGFQIFTHKDS